MSFFEHFDKMGNFSFNSSFIGKSNHFPNQSFFDCLKNEQVESTPVKEWKDGKPEQMSLPRLEQTELIEMYLCLLLVLGLAAMNSLMNPRRRTRYHCQSTIIFEYPSDMISLIWHTIRLSASFRTLFTTPESCILVWPASVITFLVCYLYCSIVSMN